MSMEKIEGPLNRASFLCCSMFTLKGKQMTESHPEDGLFLVL